MKSLHLALVVLFVGLHCVEALRCNRCVPFRPGGSCSNMVETCQPSDDVCASVIFTFPKYSYFRRCMKRSDAFTLESIPGARVLACSTDLCN